MASLYSCDSGKLTGISKHPNKGVNNKTKFNNKKVASRPFFAHPDSTDPLIVSIINTLKKSRKIDKFTRKFVRKKGLPAWGATRIFSKKGLNIALVPVIRPKKKLVTGMWSISIEQSKLNSFNQSRKAKHRFRYRWIPWGAHLKGDDMPDERTVDIFILGFEKQIFGSVHIAGVKVENKKFKIDSTDQARANRTANMPVHWKTGHYELRRGRMTCTRIDSGPMVGQFPNGNWTQIPRQHEDDSIWNCTYDYYRVWVPDPGDSGDDGPSGGGGDGSGRGSDNGVISADAFDNRIIDNDLAPCMKDEMNGLANNNTGAGEIVHDFAVDELKPDKKLGNMNWKVKDGDLPKDVDGETLVKFNSKTNTVTTIFDSDKFKNATSMAVAQTILHEAVHAYLVFVEYKVNFDSYKNYLGADWLKFLSESQHTYMAIHYRDQIAGALAQLSRNRYRSPFYDYMAWGGLMRYKDQNGHPHQYQFFKDAVRDASDRLSIENTVHGEHYGTDIHGNSRYQIGTDAGC